MVYKEVQLAYRAFGGGVAEHLAGQPRRRTCLYGHWRLPVGECVVCDAHASMTRGSARSV